MVGVSTGDAGQLSKASVKKTMEDLTKELEHTDQANDSGISNSSGEYKVEDRDPLFVANVGDYYSGMAKTGSPRWVRGENNWRPQKKKGFFGMNCIIYFNQSERRM